MATKAKGTQRSGNGGKQNAPVSRKPSPARTKTKTYIAVGNVKYEGKWYEPGAKLPRTFGSDPSVKRLVEDGFVVTSAKTDPLAEQQASSSTSLPEGGDESSREPVAGRVYNEGDTTEENMV